MWSEFFQLLKLLVLLPYTIFKVRRKVKKQKKEDSNKDLTKVGLFHIPCDTNGGGEKVLWSIAADFLKKGGYEIYVFSRPIEDKAAMIDKANKYFGMDLDVNQLNFVELEIGNLTYHHNYTFLSRYLEALSHYLVMPYYLDQFMPDVMIESMSAHFSAKSAKLCNPDLKYITYVHFPFTSQLVVDGFRRMISDKSAGLKRRIFGAIKWVYNVPLLWFYKGAGKSPDLILANSSWTADHCRHNWESYINKIKVEYPPCNVNEFWCQDFENKEPLLLSFAQFRPEKRHEIQLDAWARFKREHPNSKLKLKMVGSCKDEGSMKLSQEIEAKIKTLNIPDVEVIRNQSFTQIKSIFAKAAFGIHTMIDEHFGIAVVEMLAGGMVVMAHNSAGPKEDILHHGTETYGRLCEDDTYYTALCEEWEKYQTKEGRKQQIEMIKKGQAWCKQELTNDAFGDRLFKMVQTIM